MLPSFQAVVWCMSSLSSTCAAGWPPSVPMAASRSSTKRQVGSCCSRNSNEMGSPCVAASTSWTAGRHRVSQRLDLALDLRQRGFGLLFLVEDGGQHAGVGLQALVEVAAEGQVYGGRHAGELTVHGGGATTDDYQVGLGGVDLLVIGFEEATDVGEVGGNPGRGGASERRGAIDLDAERVERIDGRIVVAENK